jgi:primase-polymerase (primpol)-like protein
MSIKTQEQPNNTNGSSLNGTSKEDEPILTELKNRQQWVCWEYKYRDGKKTKIPINPHTGRYASSTNSDTWSTFEKAQDRFETSGVDGLGFVFSNDDRIAGVDLDNVRDPNTGKIERWAQDVIDALDSYTEVSPSGTGVHILQFGTLPADADTREDQESTLEAFSESEIEMYDSGRFFTMSFDHVDSTPTKLQERNDELQNVHTQYVADEENDTDAEKPTIEPTTKELDLSDQELIEKAKDSKNGHDFARLWNGDTSAYDGDHSRADMGLLSHLAFWTQKDATRMERLFEKSGLARDKWTDRVDYRERSIQKAIRNCTSVYEPESQDEEQEIQRTAAFSDLVTSNGCYCKYSTTRDGEQRLERVTTYTLEATAVLVNPVTESKKWDITVKPTSNVEDPYDVVVEPSIFNDLRSYKDEIQIGETTAYEGSPADLNDIRQIVAHQDVPRRIATTKIGLHGEELVTPNGVFTADGSDPAYRHVETGNAMDSKWDLDDLNDFDEEAVKRILEILPQTRDSERFIPILGWMYASVFTPHIREWEAEVPMVGVDADTGAGKTSIIGFLTSMMGLDGTPMSAQDTKFSLLKNLASTTSIPVWLDEYKPSDMSQYKLDQTQDLLRKVTRGGHETRGNADKTQEIYSLKAPVILSGEQAIQGAAEQRRMIRTQLKKAATESGSESAQAWAQLDGGSYQTTDGVQYCDGYDPHHHAKAYHQFVLTTDDVELEETWQECKTVIYELLSDHNISGINGIELVALTMVKWGMTIYSKFAYDMGADMHVIPQQHEIKQSLLYLAHQMGETNRTSHLEELMELVSDTARERKLVDGQHFAIIHAGKENEQLLLKLRATHQVVTEYVTTKGLTGYDLLNKSKDYRARFSDDDNYVVDMSKYHNDLNRSIALDIDALDDSIEDFSAESFYHS